MLSCPGYSRQGICHARAEPQVIRRIPPVSVTFVSLLTRFHYSHVAPCWSLIDNKPMPFKLTLAALALSAAAFAQAPAAASTNTPYGTPIAADAAKKIAAAA